MISVRANITNSGAFVFFIGLFCGVLQAQTLPQAVAQAIKVYPSILSAQLQQSAAAKDVRSEQAGYLPKVDILLGYGEEWSDNPATRAALGGSNQLFRQESSFLVRQLLFDGGNVSNRVAKTKADYKTVSEQAAQTQQAIALAVSGTYLSILADQELLNIAALNVAAHEKTYRQISHRANQGVDKRSDRELALSRLAQAKANYIQWQGRLKDDEATFYKLTQHYPKSLVKPAILSGLPLTMNAAQELAAKLNPTLLASEGQIDSRRADVGINRSSYFPTITLNLDASFDNSLDGVEGHDNQRSAIVELNYRPFNGGADRAAVSAANYRVVSAEQDSQNIQREVLESVAFSWNELEVANQRIPELRSHVRQSKQVWQDYIKQFKLGKRTLFDVLNAQAEYYRSETSLIEGTYQAQAQRYQLLATIGNLTTYLLNKS